MDSNCNHALVNLNDESMNHNLTARLIISKSMPRNCEFAKMIRFGFDSQDRLSAHSTNRCY